VELVVVIGIVLVILGGVLSMLVVAFRTQSGQSARTDALDEMRGATARMTKEIRQALSIATCSSTQVLDMQTLINGTQARVIYDVSGTNLRRTRDPSPATAPCVPASNAITMTAGLNSTAVFAYSPTTWTSAPAVVTITVIVQPRQSGATPVTLRTDIQLRNSTG
jgi:type II secretory pathway pseudopilin PulG